jgi:hypothetical protein
MSHGVDVTLFVLGEGLRRTEVPPQASATLALAELLDLAAALRELTGAPVPASSRTRRFCAPGWRRCARPSADARWLPICGGHRTSSPD